MTNSSLEQIKTFPRITISIFKPVIHERWYTTKHENYYPFCHLPSALLSN
ncbi:hypothetical protein [Fischerella thermalis]|nr:hypothetical protein [Fischerella thermalis]